MNDKRKAMMLDILPYLKDKMSANMGEEINIVLVTVDSKGDAMATSTLRKDLNHNVFESLAMKKYDFISGWFE